MLIFNILRAGALLVLILAKSTSTARPLEGGQDELGTTSRRRAYVTVLYTLIHYLRTALGFSSSCPSQSGFTGHGFTRDSCNSFSCSYAIVQPIADKTSLHLESEGLAALRDITSPVAPVVVIGPYRSGKSFLLNQLLGVGCGKEAHLLL